MGIIDEDDSLLSTTDEPPVTCTEYTTSDLITDEEKTEPITQQSFTVTQITTYSTTERSIDITTPSTTEQSIDITTHSTTEQSIDITTIKSQTTQHSELKTDTTTRQPSTDSHETRYTTKQEFITATSKSEIDPTDTPSKKKNGNDVIVIMAILVSIACLGIAYVIVKTIINKSGHNLHYVSYE